MSELVDFEAIQRPARREEVVRVRLLAPEARRSAVFWAVIVVVAELWLLGELIGEGFSAAAWARFLLPQVLVFAPGIRAGLRALRKTATTLEFGTSRLRIQWQSGVTEEVPYADIKEFSRFDQGDLWLRVETKDHRLCEVRRADVAWAGNTAESLMFHVGPHLASGVVQNRGLRPEDPAYARAWDHFWDPPAVTMVPGRRYRYLDRNYLRGEARRRLTPWPAILLGLAFTGQNLVHGADPAVVLALVVFWMTVIFFGVVHLMKGIRLWRAADDRFEVVADGLRITRGDRSWVVRGGQPAVGMFDGVRSFGRPFIRFGSYLFDPRFIEEDA